MTDNVIIDVAIENNIGFFSNLWNVFKKQFAPENEEERISIINNIQEHITKISQENVSYFQPIENLLNSKMVIMIGCVLHPI